MISSLAWWLVPAFLLFWSVGAYNRLVRLRARANTAFAELDGQLQQQLELAQQCLPPEAAHPASQFEGGSAFWGSLQGASAQFAASLSAARSRPLEPERIAALSAALEVFATAWERAERDDAHDLAGPRLPEHVTGERLRLARQVDAAGERFGQAVAQYNEAIAQFPAQMLAWLFAFKPARSL